MLTKFILNFITVLVFTKSCIGDPTGVQLLANLKDKDFVFDLGKATPATAGGNKIRKAQISQFPTLAKMGISFQLFELTACGINFPHIHPRASELLYVSFYYLTN